MARFGSRKTIVIGVGPVRGCREPGSKSRREAAGGMLRAFLRLCIPACEMELLAPALSTVKRMDEVMGSQCSSPGSADHRGCVCVCVCISMQTHSGPEEGAVRLDGYKCLYLCSIT